MSKLGENADRTLEKLNNGEELSINELRNMPADVVLINFMEECGLIELKNGEARITEFGSDLLKIK